jgi:hypothetical protein
VAGLDFTSPTGTGGGDGDLAAERARGGWGRPACAGRGRLGPAGQQRADQPHSALDTFCTWRLAATAQSGPGYVFVDAYTLQSTEDARTELTALVPLRGTAARAVCTPVLDDPSAPAGTVSPSPVAGTGDEAVAFPGELLARAGNRVVTVRACLPTPPGATVDTPRPPASPALLADLARTALTTSW